MSIDTLTISSSNYNDSSNYNTTLSSLNDNDTSDSISTNDDTISPSILDLFILFDTDNDNYISENELYNGLLESLGNIDITDQIMICFKEIYKTSNDHKENLISLDEFKLAFTLFQELGGQISMSPINEDEHWEDGNEMDNNGIVHFENKNNEENSKIIPAFNINNINRTSSPTLSHISKKDILIDHINDGSLSSRSKSNSNKHVARLSTSNTSIEQQANKDQFEQIQLLNRNLKKSQDREKLWREQVNNFETEIAELNKENESLKNLVKDSSTKNSNLASINAKQVEHISSLEEQVRSASDKLMASNQKCANIQSRLDIESKFLEESKSNVAVLNNETCQLEQIIKQLESKVESLTLTINTRNATVDNLVEENTTLEKANKELISNSEEDMNNSQDFLSPDKRRHGVPAKSPAGFVPAPKTIVPQHAFPKRDESRRLEVIKPGMGSMLSDMFGVFVSIPESK